MKLIHSTLITMCLVAGSLSAVSSHHVLAAENTLYQETYRPQFHFTAKTNWLNDPNGLVYYKGEYHLFFQHNPSGNQWGNMTWGHAISPDLVHWQQLDNALLPDRLGTMFSGSAVVDWNNTAGFQKGDDKTLAALYTAAGGTSPESGNQPFTQCLAYSTDRGRTWTKYEQNPVLRNIGRENRDPKVVWHAPSRKWIMALYQDKDIYSLFSSPDLKQWTLLHDFSVPGCSECPDFFEMPVDGNKNNTRWAFVAADGRYLVGRFDGKRFSPQSELLTADWGNSYYAVQTYSDTPDGRRIQIAWMRDGKYPGMPFNQQMSFPCDMKLRTFPEGLRICRTPVREIEKLHRKTHTWTHSPLKPGENPLAGLRGDLFDIAADIALGNATEVGFKIRGEPVRYIKADKKLACLGKTAELIPDKGTIRLRLLVDRTSLEVFANDGKVGMTSCFLPDPENQSLEIYAIGDTATIISLYVHELRSAWLDVSQR